MKVKLLQVAMGAIGSLISILLSHYANIPTDVGLGVAAGAGPATVLLSTLGRA